MSVDLSTGSVEYLSQSRVDWKVTLIDTGDGVDDGWPDQAPRAGC